MSRGLGFRQPLVWHRTTMATSASGIFWRTFRQSFVSQSAAIHIPATFHLPRLRRLPPGPGIAGDSPHGARYTMTQDTSTAPTWRFTRHMCPALFLPRSTLDPALPRLAAFQAGAGIQITPCPPMIRLGWRESAPGTTACQARFSSVAGCTTAKPWQFANLLAGDHFFDFQLTFTATSGEHRRDFGCLATAKRPTSVRLDPGRLRGMAAEQRRAPFRFFAAAFARLEQPVARTSFGSPGCTKGDIKRFGRQYLTLAGRILHGSDRHKLSIETRSYSPNTTAFYRNRFTGSDCGPVEEDAGSLTGGRHWAGTAGMPGRKPIRRPGFRFLPLPLAGAPLPMTPEQSEQTVEGREQAATGPRITDRTISFSPRRVDGLYNTLRRTDGLQGRSFGVSSFGTLSFKNRHDAETPRSCDLTGGQHIAVGGFVLTRHSSSPRCDCLAAARHAILSGFRYKYQQISIAALPSIFFRATRQAHKSDAVLAVHRTPSEVDAAGIPVDACHPLAGTVTGPDPFSSTSGSRCTGDCALLL